MAKYTELFAEYLESGLPPDEAIRMVEKMEDQVYIIKEALLHEFDSLFMKVYWYNDEIETGGYFIRVVGRKRN